MDLFAERLPCLSFKAKQVILNSTLTQIESGCCQSHSYQSIIEQNRQVGYALRLARFCFIGGKGYTGEELCTLYKEIVDSYGYIYLPLNVTLGSTSDVAKVIHLFTAPSDSAVGRYTPASDMNIDAVYSNSCRNPVSDDMIEEAVKQFSSVGINISDTTYTSYIKCSSISEPTFKDLLAISTGSDLLSESFKGSAPCIFVV